MEKSAEAHPRNDQEKGTKICSKRSAVVGRYRGWRCLTSNLFLDRASFIRRSHWRCQHCCSTSSLVGLLITPLDHVLLVAQAVACLSDTKRSISTLIDFGPSFFETTDLIPDSANPREALVVAAFVGSSTTAVATTVRRTTTQIPSRKHFTSAEFRPEDIAYTMVRG
jgi:hypothetical protein